LPLLSLLSEYHQELD